MKNLASNRLIYSTLDGLLASLPNYFRNDVSV